MCQRFCWENIWDPILFRACSKFLSKYDPNFEQPMKIITCDGASFTHSEVPKEYLPDGTPLNEEELNCMKKYLVTYLKHACKCFIGMDIIGEKCSKIIDGKKISYALLAEVQDCFKHAHAAYPPF
jgi:hypothetical protein